MQQPSFQSPEVLTNASHFAGLRTFLAFETRTCNAQEETQATQKGEPTATQVQDEPQDPSLQAATWALHDDRVGPPQPRVEQSRLQEAMLWLVSSKRSHPSL